ncbi:uncharacterized protein [Montipora foliosa]|uniref:uncharacterized protein n=1 Tax=Montipora foliosa TaxID=591990 RepID=UPI0035F17CD0
MNSESQPRSRLESKHLSSSSIATTSKSQIRGHLSSLSHYQQVSLSKISLITPSPAFLPLWDKFTVSSPQEQSQPDIVSYPTPSNSLKLSARTQGKTSTPSLFDTSASSVLSVEHTYSHLFISEEITATKTNAETSQSSQVRTVSTRLAGVTGHNKEQDTFGYFSHLFKSIKDTLTKKNSNREITFSVNGYKGVSNKTIVISEGVTASFPATPKLGFGTDEMHDLNSLSRSLFPGISNTNIVLASDMAGTGRLSMTASTSKSFPVTPTKSSQHTASVGLDISEAMRPLHWSSPLCEHSTINFNSTLRGGIQAGVLTDVGEVRSDAECINQCCLYKSCDVAFLILSRCFLVACKSKRLCESVPAGTLAFRPRVIYKQNRVTMPKERNSKTTNKPFNATSGKKEISSSPSLSYSGKKRATVVTDKVKNAKAGSLCIASITLQNASFRNGINSGFFKDEGSVISMEKCVELCCSRSNCTVAFMLVNRCFAVSCYNESSCKSIPARRSIFQPQLAYVRRNLVSFFITSTSSLEMIPISPTKADLFASLTYVTSAETKRKIAQFHRSCRYGNKEKKVTLRGGINAGSFLDSGVVTNIEQCVTQCCHSTKCDVAFMITRRCFLVTCFSFHLCESVPARKIDYFTELVHVSREKTAVTRDLLASLVQPSSPSVKKRNNVERLVAPTWHPSSMLSTLNWKTSGSLNTLIGSKHLPLISLFIDSYMMFRSPNVPPAVPAKGALIESTIEPIKVNTREDVRLIQTLSMSTLRKSIRHSLEKTITPSSLRVKSLSSKSGWAEHDRKGTLRRKTFETEKAFVKDETCQSTIVYYNATMRGGIKAGIFRDQGSVQNMRKCIEQCCRWQFCSVAFMVLTRCYTIACYNEHLCDPVPARNLTFTPRIGFVSRIRRDQGNLTNTLENKTLLSNQPSTGVNASLTTMNSSFNQATENFAPSTTTKLASNLSSIEISPSPARSLLSKVFTESWESRRNCTSSEQRQNVTLRGGLNAGRFKDNGKVANAQQCVEFCCKERHCDLALMLLDNCFTVRCHNRHLCESVPAKTLKYRSRIIYLKKIPGGNSSNVKSTKTISLLDGALLAMADQNQSTVVETYVKSTPNGTVSFDSESLAQILMPSPSIINSNAELKHSIFDLRKWNSAERLINQNKITSIQKRLNPTTIAFMSYNQIRVLPSLSSNKNDSMGLLSLLQTYASNHSEPRKSAFVERMISRASSGPSKTLGDPSRRLTPHPSSCLKSPISYNVTLRNGIRSGYFRDQGRVENMSECIRQCCDFDTCDVAFMLKQRCYLVMCYTKTGCQTVKARQSLFRPCVAYVQRTNESQLRTFMDGQVEESRNSVNVIHITPSSTLPVAVKTLNYSNKISNKTKGSYGKSINSKTLHTKGEYHKTKHKVHRGNSGKLTRHHKTKHVTKVLEHVTSVPKHVTGVAKHLSTVTGLKERKRRKPMKTRHGKARAIGVKDSSVMSNANTEQNIKRELEKKKDKWLSHSDLEKLFRLMKVNGTTGTKSSFPKKGKERITRKSKSHYMTDSKRRSEIVKGQLFDRSKTKSTNTVTFGKAKHKKTATASTVRTRKKQKLRKGKKSTVPSLPTKAPHAGFSNCKTGQVEYNQTLLGGLSSGLFHEIGQVNDISTCSQHCCSSPICDLAFMVLQHCFLVTCSTSNPSMCESTPALATSFNPMICRVSRNEDETVIQETVTIPKYKFSPSTASSTKISLQRPEILASVADNKTTSTSPSEIPTSLPTVAMRTSNSPTVNGDIDLVHNTKMTVAGCISSVTEHNVTLRGGLHAGKFTDAGLVNGSSTCTEFCCKEDTCDVAFYAFNRCFLVDCFDEYLCSFTPSLLPTFTPTVIHVYRHHSKPTPKPATTIPPVNIVMEEIEDETQTNVKAPSRENRSCAHSEVYQEVTLRMGYNAGNFTPRGKVNSTNECVRECCEQQGCDLIFMFLDNCYTVSCLSSFACEIVPARKSTFKPRVVYFIKNNSSSVIKPSDFNSSLYRLNSTGEGPVNLVHYKEVPLEQRSHSSDKKDVSKQSYITRKKDGELSNDTQTVVEEFVVFPSAKTTPQNVSKTTGNGSLNVLKHNAGNHSLVKNGVKNHTKSRTDKEIDVLINKLSHVTEENRHLESEIHFLMSKQDEIEQTKNISSDSTRGSFKGQKRRPRSRSKKGTAYMENDGKSRTRNKKAGSPVPVDSRATKRVVLVDTDRPPVYPPTDEHYIGEHSIQRIREKVHNATHVGSSREMRLRDKGLKSPVRMILKSKASEWSLRSENRRYGSLNSNVTGSRFDVGVIDGLDGKNVPSGLDNKNREFGRIINLNPTMKTRKRPEKPALDTLSSKVSDNAEMPHRNKDLDAFQSENRMKPEETMQQDWIDSESKTGDSTSSFNGTIVEEKTENQDHFQIERPLESSGIKAKVDTSFPGRNADHIESLHRQTDHVHGSTEAFNDNGMNAKENEDRFITDVAKGGNEPQERELGGFYQQMPPRNRSRFRIDEQAKMSNTRGYRLNLQNVRNREEEGLINLENKINEHRKGKQEEIISVLEPNLHLASQKEKEKDFGNKEEVEFENPENDNKVQIKSSSLRRKTQFESQRQSKEEKGSDLHMDSQDSEVKDVFDKEESKMIQPAANVTTKPKSRFVTSEAYAAHMEGNLGATHPGEKALKIGHLQDHKSVSNDDDEDQQSLANGGKQVSVEKEDENIFPSSGGHHGRPTSIDRVQAQTSHLRRRHDFEAIFDKINLIYNRLQDLMRLHDQEHNETTEHYSRRHEEHFPTPSVSSKSAFKVSTWKPTRGMTFGQPSGNKVTVVKQYVSDKTEGSGKLSRHHRDQLMDYVTRIYRRLQEIYNRNTKGSAPKKKHIHKTKKVNRKQEMGRKPIRKETRSSITKAAHQKRTRKDELVLKKMKLIYKKMKEMYRQEKISRKAAEDMAHREERQRQRSFIPTRSTEPATILRDMRPIHEGALPLNGRNGGEQNKSSQHSTHDVHRLAHDQSEEQPFLGTAQKKKEKEGGKLLSGSNKDGHVLANNLFARRPTVNQSFIDKIVAEIAAKNSSVMTPLLKKNPFATNKNDSIEGRNLNSVNPLQRLIDNVAESVVKEVTTELRGEKYQPSKRVVVPKAATMTQKSNASFPLDHKGSKSLALGTSGFPQSSPNPLQSEATNDLQNKDIQRLSSSLQEKSPSSKLSLWGSDHFRGTASQRGGLEEIRELLNSMNRSRSRIKLESKDLSRPKARSKSHDRSRPRGNKKSNSRSRLRGFSKSRHASKSKTHVKYRNRSSSKSHLSSNNWSRGYLKPKRPTTETAKKKLTIPATTEGNAAYLILHIGFETIENRSAIDSSGHDNSAVLSPEVGLSVTKAKCGAALRMRGGHFLFASFNSRPREGITIALWLKLDSVSGIATLFKTTGSGAKYTLQVTDGVIHWSHVDDLSHVIFSMETRHTVDSLDWVHLGVTYDSHINKSKIILNGDVLDEKEGHGLLSQNWDGEVGVGIPEGIRGLIDEFYMYNHAIAASDLADLSEECNPGAGGAIPINEGSYDGLIPEQMVEDAMRLLHPNDTFNKDGNQPSSAQTTQITTTNKPLTSSTTQQTPTKAPSTTTTLTTTKTLAKSTTLPTALPSLALTSRKPTLNGPPTVSRDNQPELGDASPTITLQEEPNCQQGMFYFNSELRGGMNAGLFINLGKVKGSTSCLKLCCEIGSCDLVFMTRENCYAVDCFNNKLCEPVTAVPYRSDMPSVHYVTRSGKSVLDEKLHKLADEPTKLPTTQKPTALLPSDIITSNDLMLEYQRASSQPTYNPSPATKRFCAQGMFFYNVKLRDGWNAGMLLQVARVDYMTECIELCCDEPACDFVMMKNKKCHTVRCRGGDTCTVEEGGDYQISFVSRQDMFEDEDMVTPSPTPLPLSPLGGDRADLASDHIRHLSLYIGFDHVIGSVAVDGSGLNNDARLTKGAEVVRPGKRGAAIKLNGGDVLLDGEHFREKPQEAITIALWVNLWRTDGEQSIFDTIGGHSINRNRQYHFEVLNGHLRWLHRNEYAEEIFHVKTLKTLQPNVWYHVTGTYDSRTHLARVFVNGDLEGKEHGSGLLSLDWGARAGFGSNLFGYLDEIYIYRRSLLEGEIDRYLDSPSGNSFLHAASNSADMESFTETPSTSSFSDLNTDSVWFSQPTIRVTKEPQPRTPHTTIHYVVDTSESSNARLETGTGKPGINTLGTPLKASKESKTTPITTVATTETTVTQSTEKPTTMTTTKPTTVTPTLPTTKYANSDSTCKFGDVYRNRDLVGGLGAGNFTDKGVVNTIEDCMKTCCAVKDCSVAYMVENNCFAISCKEREQCETFVKSPLENSPVIGFVDRFKPGESTLVNIPVEETKHIPTSSVLDSFTKEFYTEEDNDEALKLMNMLFSTTPTPSTTPTHAKSSCTYSKLYHHVSLVGGLQAGNFSRLVQFSNMAECVRRCCAQRSCDVAILMRDTCFALQCKTPELCSARPARLKNFSLQIVYMYRKGTEAPVTTTQAPKTTEPSLKNLLGEVKSTQSPTTAQNLNNMLGFPRVDASHATTSRPPTECSQGLTVNNVILNGGMGAGQVAEFPKVSDIQLCIEKCCLSTKCHVAYVIQDACYTISCFSRDLCRTRPIENISVKSIISYVKREGVAMFSNADEAKVGNTGNLSLESARITASPLHSSLVDSDICQKDKTFYNVRLKGGQSSGLFAEKGLEPDISQCAGVCCEDPSCDLAFIEGPMCYNVKCYNQTTCQLIEANHLSVKTALAYVIRLKDKDVIPRKPPSVFLPPTQLTIRGLETTKQVLTTTPTPSTTASHGASSKDKDHVRQHEQRAGSNVKRPFHHFKHKLHKGHRHRLKGYYDECPARKYGCHHYCINLPDGGHRCMCHRGYTLASNGRHCEDVDECFENRHGCEQHCVNNHGSYLCNCRSGFMLNKDRKHCDDLNECLLEIHSCSHSCHNTIGSYECSCDEGYQLSSDKHHCLDTTEMGSKKDEDHPVVAGLEIPTAITQAPKDLTKIQGESGIFYCKARGHPAPHIAWASGLNGDLPIPSEERFRILPSGSLVIRRVNFTDEGMYRCVASNPVGSATAAALLKVTDFDECKTRSDDCQQVCVNTHGSFRCECHSGYMLEKDRKACQDVDECILGSHMCDHICHNTAGSFRCSCQWGYRLMADLITCTDIDECTEPGHGCSQLCNNTEGSYNCFCLKGFFLQKDNKTCVDHNIILDSSKPTTLSAGLGAFVALAGISMFIILGTVMCVIRYKRKARVRSARLAEDGKKSLFSWTE